MDKKSFLLPLIGLHLMLLGCKQTNSYQLYLDQVPPTSTPKLFAPAIVNTDSIEINTVFNSALTELFFQESLIKNLSSIILN